ncbi:MAG TPA: Maf family protein [Pseudolabrys sp.]|nr:Maf family protein [Pseudolabrys sp.]
MPLWLASLPLVLASKSEVRGKILAAAGLRVEIRPASIDERAIEAEAGPLDARQAAALLARAKALTISGAMPGRLVLGADQTLALAARRFSKPAGRAEARVQVRALRAKTHELHSALAVARDGAVLFEHGDTARLTMRDVSDDYIESYLDLAGDAAMASVGGYQIEGAGIHLFERIDGDYFTILGLPLLPLLDFLRQQGVIAK